MLALGVRRDSDVLDVYIGSGKDAYVTFKARGDEPAHAVHFTIATSVRRIIDGFDKDKNARTQIIVLKRPSTARTLEHRRTLNNRRHKEIRNGATVARRGSSVKRVARIGVEHRPRPRVSEGGSVNAVQMGLSL